MSVRCKLIFILLLAIFCAGESLAAGTIYGGPKIGKMLITTDEIDDIVSLGLLGGYAFRDEWSIEAELNTTISGGEVDVGVPGDADVTTMAGYLVRLWPQGGGSYIRGKIGFLVEDMVICAGNYCESSNDAGLSYGLTAGHRFTSSLEFEVGYTVLEKDIAMISLGINF